jgi:hypothetical protein
MCIHPEVSITKGNIQSNLCRRYVFSGKCVYHQSVKGGTFREFLFLSLCDL